MKFHKFYHKNSNQVKNTKHIFYQDLTHNNIIKISNTCGKNYGVFVRDLGKAWVQIARKLVHIAKKTQETKGRNPGPKRYGSWTIQTCQGRWIDPGSKNPRSNGYKYAAHHKTHQAHTKVRSTPYTSLRNRSNDHKPRGDRFGSKPDWFR
jgi:hypothetical protein